MTNSKIPNWFIVGFFGCLAGIFIAALIFWTVLPYLQLKIYFLNRRADRLGQILNHNFIFSPYTNAQSLIRSAVLNFSPSSDKSIAYMEDQLARGGFNPYEYVYTAIAYAEKGAFDKAETYFKKAIDLSPKRQELYYSYGQFLWDRGRIGEAQEVFRYALELGEQAIFSHFYLGLILMASEQPSYEEALDHFEFFFSSPDSKQYEISSYNPDQGWFKSKAAYMKFLAYFYNQKDKQKVLVVASRLAELDEPQSASFLRIESMIKNTGQLPVIEFLE